jgi:phage-related protein
MKAFEFVSEAARADYLALPRPVQRRFGRCLRAVQEGKPAPAVKCVAPMVGRGAAELVQNGSPAYRVIFSSKDPETVCVLHAFTKTDQGADRPNLETARKRYRERQRWASGRGARVSR